MSSCCPQADLYAGALFITESTGFEGDGPIYISILILLAIATLFTVAGGLAAVIWTDFIQTVLMIIGAIVLSALGGSQVTHYHRALKGLSSLNSCHLCSFHPRGHRRLRESDRQILLGRGDNPRQQGAQRHGAVRRGARGRHAPPPQRRARPVRPALERHGVRARRVQHLVTTDTRADNGTFNKEGAQ